MKYIEDIIEFLIEPGSLAVIIPVVTLIIAKVEKANRLAKLIIRLAKYIVKLSEKLETK